MNITCFIFNTKYAIVEFNNIYQLQITTSILTQFRIRTVRNIDVHTDIETECTNSFQLFLKVLKMPYRLKFYFPQFILINGKILKHFYSPVFYILYLYVTTNNLKLNYD